MRLADFILEEAIIAELRATAKPDVLNEMVQSLADAGCLERESAGSVVEALLHREEIGNTAIGQGVAIPHAKHPAVRRLLGAFAHSTGGVDYSAPDGQPVRSIFMILWPEGVIGPHLEAIAQVSRALKTDNFMSRLHGTSDRLQIVRLFEQVDKKTEG